ncbi:MULTISPECIES: GyrI-like domain-containing protein [unclassified Fusibacter]|uniref:GyrI-like domain-containing protein n=1 Tax=unclassified Fusibacter TaxID=2624464 RepID=UPI0010119159|nr:MULTISPECIES: GyrI-like domain-containing protein [unclassified Fusibacter]MCK8061614.1 GyrI-like domain-containing protein [Fusibacter sp. A2]NPE23797.1 GyrI-like domain-containing protein [Fusibacter sp. A1]RXV58702.1 AraC family transcriptional regulator [Fusibacter sp. A1]
MEKAQQLEFKVRELREKQKQIRSEVDDLKEVKFMSEVQEVMIKELEDLQVACIRYKGKYQEVGQYLGQLFKQVGMHAVGAPFSLYYDEEYTEEDADVEVCVEVKKKVDKGGVTSRTLKGCKVVSIVHVGPYETLSKSYKAIEDYIIEKGLTSYAPSREIYHKGPGMLMKGNPEKYRTEIQMPVR